jgi:hypothetical protein
MYATVRSYRLGSGSVDELMHLVDQEFAPKLSDEPGFEDYQAIDCGDGRILSITIFRDEAGCERSNELSADWVNEHLGGFDITRTDVFQGEVMVSRAAADLLEPVHH